MASGRIKLIVAGALFASAGLLLFMHYRPMPPTVDPRPQRALGRIMAAEAAKLLGADGRVTVLTRDTVERANPASDFQWEGFISAARKANLPLAGTNWLRLDPLRIVKAPPGDFLELLRKRKSGDVVVSFLGPPLLDAKQRAVLGDKKVSVVALCAGAMPRQVDLRELFDQGLLHVAVISRFDPPSIPPKTDDPQAWFEQSYRLITAANLAELPEPSRTMAR